MLQFKFIYLCDYNTRTDVSLKWQQWLQMTSGSIIQPLRLLYSIIHDRVSIRGGVSRTFIDAAASDSSKMLSFFLLESRLSLGHWTSMFIAPSQESVVTNKLEISK